MLHLHEEALVLAPIGGAPSIGSGTHDDFNNEAYALHSEQILCSNPSVSDVHTIIYSLFTISCRLSGGTVLTAPRTPYDRFPYGLASPMDACARGLRGTLSPSPLTFEFVGLTSFAPTTFHNLPDDEGESDGSSIGDVAPSHRPSWECAVADPLGHPLAKAESSRTHTSPNPHTETPELTLEHGEELRQRWLHQPPTAPARLAHHTAPRVHRLASSAWGRTCQV